MKQAKPHLKAVPAQEEVLCSGGEYPPLLAEREFVVDAVCTAVKKFPAFGRESFQFTLMVFEPPEHEGQKLHCYAPFRQKWKTKGLPRNCKLMQLATIASEQRRIKGITKSLFLNKAFRCLVRPTGKGKLRYSVVSHFLEKLAG